MDFEDNVSTAGNLRITFKFKAFENMVYSIEEYTGVNIETLDIVDELCKHSSASDANWQQLKIDLYNHNVPMLKNYEIYSIGDLYWNGLFSKEITPWSDMD